MVSWHYGRDKPDKLQEFWIPYRDQANNMSKRRLQGIWSGGGTGSMVNRQQPFLQCCPASPCTL